MDTMMFTTDVYWQEKDMNYIGHQLNLNHRTLNYVLILIKCPTNSLIQALIHHQSFSSRFLSHFSFPKGKVAYLDLKCPENKNSQLNLTVSNLSSDQGCPNLQIMQFFLTLFKTREEIFFEFLLPKLASWLRDVLIKGNLVFVILTKF